MQYYMQPTHIVRVLGDAIRRTRTNVRGVVHMPKAKKAKKAKKAPAKKAKKTTKRKKK